MKFILKMSLSTRIIIGALLGIFTGLFFGEAAGWLVIVGNGFIKLLQMTILPYIVASLILGIGSLSFKNAKSLAWKGGVLLCVFWGLALSVIMVMPIIFPQMESGAFFSVSSVIPKGEVDYLGIYIPSNPFNALSSSTIPAVVLFCLCIGIAMISMGEEKKPLLDILRLCCTALTKVAHFVVGLTPFGVFAIAAAASGTMTVEEFGRLQVYFVTFIGSALLLAVVIYPFLTSMLTPFKYGDIVNLSKDALVTAFATGNLFVILPIITENSKALFKKYNCGDEETESLMDVIIPIYFNFPDSGKLMSLLFVMFSAWFIGSPMPIANYPEFIFAGFFSFFGGVDMALPYLLDSFHIPKDLFQLYMVAGIINGRFGTLLAAMDLIAFTLICTGSLIGLVKFRLRRMVIYSSLMLGISIAVIILLKITLNYTFKNNYKENKILENMFIHEKAPCKVFKNLQSTGMIKEVLSKAPTLARIMNRKLIRVGYNPDTIPFSYFNGKGDLVGYDIAMAHHLATALKCKLEFYPVEYKDVNKQLDSGNIDIAMSGLSVSITELTRVDFTRPYMTMTMAFVVKSYHKDKFESQKALTKNKNLRIATTWNSSVIPMIKQYLPEAKIELLKTNQDFFTGKVKADALLISAEAGSAWTLKYPTYSVALPQPLLYKTEAAYAVAKNNPDLLIFLSQWLSLAQLNGVMEKEYNYWILGHNKDNQKSRWCIKTDVLGWK